MQWKSVEIIIILYYYNQKLYPQIQKGVAMVHQLTYLPGNYPAHIWEDALASHTGNANPFDVTDDITSHAWFSSTTAVLAVASLM